MTSPRGDVIRRPTKFEGGDVLTARDLNKLVDPVSRLGRTALAEQQELIPYIWRQVFQAKINAIHGDFLDCREYREYSGGESFTGTSVLLIAKPWLLRRTPFDGQTYNGVSYIYTDDQTRTATQDATTETQRITPAYVVGDIVFAARNVFGGTSVQDPSAALVALIIDEIRTWAADPPP